VRHSQKKWRATDRSALRNTAPDLDPTCEGLGVKFPRSTRLRRVGAERAALAVTSFGSPKAPHVSPLPSPNRTCAFQRIRLSIHWSDSASPAKFPLRSADIPGDSSRFAFGYLCSRIPTNCAPSPCGWLSQPQTTMDAPTLKADIDGLLILAFRLEPPTFTKLDCCEIT